MRFFFVQFMSEKKIFLALFVIRCTDYSNVVYLYEEFIANTWKDKR